MMEGMDEPSASVLETLLLSENRPLFFFFFVTTAAAGMAAKLAAVDLEGPAAAQSGSAIVDMRMCGAVITSTSGVLRVSM